MLPATRLLPRREWNLRFTAQPPSPIGLILFSTQNITMGTLCYYCDPTHLLLSSRISTFPFPHSFRRLKPPMPIKTPTYQEMRSYCCKVHCCTDSLVFASVSSPQRHCLDTTLNRTSFSPSVYFPSAFSYPTHTRHHCELHSTGETQLTPIHMQRRDVSKKFRSDHPCHNRLLYNPVPTFASTFHIMCNRIREVLDLHEQSSRTEARVVVLVLYPEIVVREVW